MTTVIYADGVIAADTLVTKGDTRVGEVQKVGKHGPVIWGGAGRLSEVQAFGAWITGGMDGDPPENEESSIVMASRMEDGSFFVTEYTPTGWVTLKAKYLTLGSGSEIAMGAMDAGATPVDAVKIAIGRDIYSGGSVEFVSLHSVE